MPRTDARTQRLYQDPSTPLATASSEEDDGWTYDARAGRPCYRHPSGAEVHLFVAGRQHAWRVCFDGVWFDGDHREAALAKRAAMAVLAQANAPAEETFADRVRARRARITALAQGLIDQGMGNNQGARVLSRDHGLPYATALRAMIQTRGARVA